jgi:hypothetical protein
MLNLAKFSMCTSIIDIVITTYLLGRYVEKVGPRPEVYSCSTILKGIKVLFLDMRRRLYPDTAVLDLQLYIQVLNLVR